MLIVYYIEIREWYYGFFKDLQVQCNYEIIKREECDKILLLIFKILVLQKRGDLRNCKGGWFKCIFQFLLECFFCKVGGEYRDL